MRHNGKDYERIKAGEVIPKGSLSMTPDGLKPSRGFSVYTHRYDAPMYPCFRPVIETIEITYELPVDEARDCAEYAGTKSDACRKALAKRDNAAEYSRLREAYDKACRASDEAEDKASEARSALERFEKANDV